MKLSVIIPAYNAEKYIERCIESVLSQTRLPDEIICVDDGSADDTGLLCDNFSQKYENVITLHKENGGQNSARLAGARIATGDYLMYVDSDDWIEENTCEVFFKKMGNTRPDMCIMTGYYWEYKKGSVNNLKKVKEGYVGKEDFDKIIYPLFICEDNFYSTIIPTALFTTVFKKELSVWAFEHCDKDLRLGEDAVMMLTAILKATSVCLVSDSKYHYLQNEKSVTHSKKYGVKEIKILFESLKKAVEYSANPELWKNKIIQICFYCLMFANYRPLLELDDYIIFPYDKIKRNQKIVIYGIGGVGVLLTEALLESHKIEVVGLVDKNKAGEKFCGFDILKPEALKSLNYDVVLLSVANRTVAESIEKDLALLGIEKDKIAKMNSKLLTEEFLDKIFKNYC